MANLELVSLLLMYFVGSGDGYGVYGFIRDLIREGKDATFVDKRGRYALNWPRALDCYAAYKAKKTLTSRELIKQGEKLAIA